MKRVWMGLMAVFLLATTQLAGAISFEQKTFDQLVLESTDIFIGTATTAVPRRLAAGGIVTDVGFANVQVLKGNTANTTISLMVMGGSLGGETFEVRGLPRFQLGVTYLVFSQGNGTTIFPVLGGDQGMFQVQPDATTGVMQVLNFRGAPVTYPSVLQALSQATPAPIPLTSFIQAVRSRLP